MAFHSIFLRSCAIDCPVIFTTAYDEYWQEAFEHNSIDYLLKPIRQEKLEQAFNKYKKLEQHFSINYAAFFQQIAQPINPNGYRKRLLIKKGTDLITLKQKILPIVMPHIKWLLLWMIKDKNSLLINRLFDLEKELDPAFFSGSTGNSWSIFTILNGSKPSLKANYPSN